MIEYARPPKIKHRQKPKGDSLDKKCKTQSTGNIRRGSIEPPAQHEYTRSPDQGKNGGNHDLVRMSVKARKTESRDKRACKTRGDRRIPVLYAPRGRQSESTAAMLPEVAPILNNVEYPFIFFQLKTHWNRFHYNDLNIVIVNIRLMLGLTHKLPFP